MAKTLKINGQDVGSNAADVNYTNQKLSGVSNAKQALDHIVEEGVGGGSSEHTLTLANVDKLLLIGDSYTEGIYYIKGKAWVNSLSELTEYSVEAYGHGGGTSQDLTNDLATGAMRNNVIAPSALGCTRAIIMDRANDQAMRNVNGVNYDALYGENMDALCAQLKKMGMTPIVATEQTEVNPFASQIIYESLARKYGAECWMTYPTNEWLGNVTGQGNEAHWSSDSDCNKWFAGSHPTQRTGGLITENILSFIKARLPRPQSAIKIYRLRRGVEHTGISSLWERVNNWQEIWLAHMSLTDAATSIWDDMTQHTSGSQNTTRISEYGMLMNGTPLLYDGGYYLLEVIVPTNKQNCTSLKVAWASNAPSSIEVWNGNSWQSVNLTDNLKNYLIGDKISIKCAAAYISNPTITWSGQEVEKTSFTYPIRRSGTELLSENDAAVIDSNLAINVTNYPYHPSKVSDYAVKGGQVAEVDNDTEKLIVSLESVKSVQGTLPDQTLRIVARWNPEADTEEVTYKSLDRRRIVVEGETTTTNVWSLIGKYDVGMHWTLIEIPMSIINNRGASANYKQRIRISGETCAMEIAIVSQLKH